MLDYFCIFTKGGALLWAMSFTTVLKGDPVNTLIRACLLEERTGDSSFGYTSPSGGAYTLKWTLNNGLGLVFVAVYQKALKLLYVDELLERVRKEFSPRYKPNCYEYKDFDATFQRIIKGCEERAEAARRPLPGSQSANGMYQQNGVKGSSRTATESEEDGEGDADGAKKAPAPVTGGRASSSAVEEVPTPPVGSSGGASSEEEEHGGNEEEHGSSGEGDGAFNTALIGKKLARRAAPGAKIGHKAPAAASKAGKGKKEAKKHEKKARKWDGADEDGNGTLDFTEGVPPSGEHPAEEAADFGKRSLIDVEDESVADSDTEEDEEEEVGGGGAAKKGGLLSSFVRSIGVSVAGTAALTREDIAPALGELKRKLMERNVAEEIAEKVTESVATSLEGQRLGSFTRVATAVKQAVEEALTRILTPKRSIDILREVRASQAKGKPYVIVFVGVNGVGKSTNLAKVAYWLLQNQVKVMIAACDTFRSGAVEQLKTHCNRLQVPLYERGYEKDPAKVAFEAAKAAERSKIDVLLVDTAGRMQDNEPLMRALSNLINLNQPDLVLFVGEALVGNDAVDQLNKFNSRLADLAQGHQKHIIDGIVLTKFDTIDEKVGAALSMVYTSGAPIMFVGCGQTYPDLKRLNVKSVVKSLLK
ncbi:hypothetical protein N2152v2_005666 [Parachlorella kessleri]